MRRKLTHVTVMALFFTFCLVAATPQKTHASHAAAADIYYTHIGGLQYIFRVYFYRDCSGVSEPSSIGLRMYSVTCGQNYVLTLPKVGVTTGTEVPPICFLGTSSCSSGSVYGVKEYSYAAVATLPMACVDWRFYYEICCRNGATLNVVSPASQRQHFFATLNNTVAVSNTLARFNEKPLPFRCIDAPFCMDLSATDADGDSLVYFMSTPLGLNGVPLTWQGGYSATQPIPSSPAMTFDNQTGQACLWPTFQGQYVLAVRAYEYREIPIGSSNWVEMGSVQRDMQINMVPCPCLFPLPVELSEFKGQNLGGYNLLKWSTASETGNDYFLLQRSFDGKSFETIGKIKGAGNSTSTIDYAWKDMVSTDKESSHYRLQQVDYNGETTYSDVITVRNYIIRADIDVYPVPFSHELNVSIPDQDPGSYIVSLRNNVGVLVRQWRIRKPEGAYTHRFEMDQDHGFYVVEVQGPNGITTFKVFSTSGSSY